MTLIQIMCILCIGRCLYFVDLTTLTNVKFFVGFLENLWLSKRHSEINWPLILKSRYIESFEFERIRKNFPRGRHHRKPLSLFFFTSHIFAQAYETKTFFNQITAWIAILILERNWIIINFVLYQSELSFLTKWHEIMKLVFRPDSLSSLLSYWSALDFWKIEFEKSSWLKLIFFLVCTWFLLPV